MTRDPFTIFVTDLTRCPMKRIYSINYPELSFAEITNGRTLIGELIHSGIERLLKDILGDEITIESEGVSRSKTVEVDGKEYTITGRIDAIINGGIGLEIKWTSNHNSLPTEPHIDQASLYNWLYGFKYTILLYLTSEGIYEYEIDERMSEDEIVRRIKAERTPLYEWECEYCEYKEICPIYRMKNRP